jgi:hypothetical protein
MKTLKTHTMPKSFQILWFVLVMLAICLKSWAYWYFPVLTIDGWPGALDWACKNLTFPIIALSLLHQNQYQKLPFGLRATSLIALAFYLACVILMTIF